MKNALITAALLLTSALAHAESSNSNQGLANQPTAKGCWKSTAASGDISDVQKMIRPAVSVQPRDFNKSANSGRAI